jgi:hypothetical protein
MSWPRAIACTTPHWKTFATTPRPSPVPKKGQFLPLAQQPSYLSQVTSNHQRLEQHASPPSSTGQTSALPSVMSHPSVMCPMPKPASATSSCSATESAMLGSSKPADLYALTQWRKPSWWWVRASPSWVARIPGKSNSWCRTQLPLAGKLPQSPR